MEPVFIAQVVGTLGYMVLEYWLGKTDKVKAGSTLEVVVNILKYLKPKIVKSEEPK